VAVQRLSISGVAQAILASGSGSGASNITIEANSITNASIAVNSASTADSNWTIRDNTISQTADSGMILYGSTFKITNNSITDTGSSITYGKHGIYLKVVGANVSGNTIRRFQANGISVRYRNSVLENNGSPWVFWGEVQLNESDERGGGRRSWGCSSATRSMLRPTLDGRRSRLPRRLAARRALPTPQPTPARCAARVGVAARGRPLKSAAARLAALDPAGPLLTARSRFADGGSQGLRCARMPVAGRARLPHVALASRTPAQHHNRTIDPARHPRSPSEPRKSCRARRSRECSLRRSVF